MPRMKPFVLVVIATETEEQALSEVLAKIYPDSFTRTHEHWLISLPCVQVLAKRLEFMGSLQACTEVSELIRKYRPAIVISAGICAALPVGMSQAEGAGAEIEHEGHQPRNLLDLIVSQEAIFYEPAKYKPSESEWRMRMYRGGRAQETLNGLKDVYLKQKGSLKWPGTIHFGRVLSGEKVIADQDKTDALRGATMRSYTKDPLALEMEYAGIAAACKYAQRPHLMIKSACDFADSSKNWDYQHKAASISLVSTLKWIESLSETDIMRLSFMVKPEDDGAKDGLFHRLVGALQMCSSGLPPRGYPGLRIAASEKQPEDWVTDWEYAIQKELFLRLHPYFDWIYAEEDWERALRGVALDPVVLDKAVKQVPTGGSGLIIDPLDGSVNFIEGRPEVAVTVLEVQRGIPYRAIVALPYRNIWVACSDGVISINGERTTMKGLRPQTLERATVSLPGDLEKVGAQENPSVGLPYLIYQYSLVAKAIRISGALGYDFCAMALEKLMPAFRHRQRSKISLADFRSWKQSAARSLT